jgi:LPS export ABC transporter protein LptC
MSRFSQTVVRDGRPVLVLEAEQARSYADAKRIVLREAVFRELDDDGEVLVTGRADRAVFHTDTEDAEISGNIELYSTREEASVRADELVWHKESRTLEGRDDGVVTLERDDGSRISGSGFSADFRRRTIRFAGQVEGVLEEQEEQG